MVDQLSGGVSYSSFFVSANVAGSISKRVRNVSDTGKSEGSLVISSFATTRHVRTFESLYYDTDKFRALKDHLQNEKRNKKIRADHRLSKQQRRKERVAEMLKRIDNEKSIKEKGKTTEIKRKEEDEEYKGEEDRVYIISEAIMGGVFVGLVHFLKTEATKENQERKDNQISVGVGYTGSGVNFDKKEVVRKCGH